ncbi:hypothetical protein [Streptomyces ipomoeae]|uniref:hypothetical protein n=1 Tax=Streptomyces ipomoeae TaxID=103232 RepID=UPI0015F0FE9B|nr:hypothetical protein [Streptomyces ipomoeae]
MSAAGQPNWATMKREDFYDDTARSWTRDKLTAQPDPDPVGTLLLPMDDSEE